jgi:hypothetical protein
MIAGRSEMRVVGVSRLANYIDTLLSRDKNLAQPFGVRGEISNYKLQNNGNVYFDLKDDRALLNCYAFAEPAAAFPPLADGALVIAYGSIGIFPKRSIYQLKVFEIVAEGGSGVLHQRYEALKKRLEAEGLFAEGRRRPLPRYPFRIALVTSPTADGARDFVTQAKARAPQVDVRRVETPVQGENAAGEIARAIGRAAAMRDVDIIVLARGGGSFEDLFAFSDERVVRALAASPMPISARRRPPRPRRPYCRCATTCCGSSENAASACSAMPTARSARAASSSTTPASSSTPPGAPGRARCATGWSPSSGGWPRWRRLRAWPASAPASRPSASACGQHPGWTGGHSAWPSSGSACSAAIRPRASHAPPAP